MKTKRVLIPNSELREVFTFDCDAVISDIKKLVDSKHRLTEEVVSISGGYRHTYTIGDITYVNRTTTYWGSDFVIYKGKKTYLSVVATLKIQDYIEKNFKL